MGKTISDLVTGDILYYGYVYYANENYRSPDRFFEKMTPIIGEFKVTSLEIITSYKKDVSDRWEESRYVDCPCNDAKIKVEPVDDNANKIIELTKNAWYAKDFNRPFTVSRREGLDHTDGNGTCLNLFTTKQAAVDYCVNMMNYHIPSDKMYKMFHDAYEYNNEQIKLLNDGLQEHND